MQNIGAQCKSIYQIILPCHLSFLLLTKKKRYLEPKNEEKTRRIHFFYFSGPPLEKPFPSEGLLVAAKLGHAQIIQHMIEAGADIDTISLFKGKNL